MKNFFYLGLIALAFTGCSSDDNGFIDPDNDPNGNGVELTGTLTASITLDASKEYTLTGSYIVPAGMKLTIPAGTEIISEKGTDKYIAVQKGGEIDIQGVQGNPVIMRSKDGSRGDWGGLLLCGEGISSAGTNVTAEVGGLIYGGTDNTDSSGKIDYLIIENAGAIIQADSQYNGLTLYAVGSGTSITNVALIDGSDDGVEFFGGAVSVTNLYLENNEDDAIDWTEGWNGTVTNAYVLHTSGTFSTVVEADKVNGNPKIVNLTAVSTTGGTALQFKKESGATISGLSLTGYDTSVDMKDNGPLANVVIISKEIVDDPNNPGTDIVIDVESPADPALSYNAAPTVNASDFAWVSTATSANRNELSGDVTSTVTLDATKTYDLISSYIVKDGGKLVIPAGTKIIARNGGTDVYIAVLQGGEIDIQGTPSSPVVISSLDENPKDWGGLTICGNASTSAGTNVTAEVGGFIYGGSSDTESSGSIKNLVIIGTGAQINSDSQYNGVSFYAVGSGTTIENIAVINGADDGVEFFGGTVSATNLYLENNQDDGVDWTEEWSGTVTNTYATYSSSFSTAVEADKVNANPSLVNFTAISTVGGTALQFKKESGATITNLYLEGFDTNVDMKDNGPLANVIIDGNAATTTNPYNSGTKVDVSGWTWKDARL